MSIDLEEVRKREKDNYFIDYDGFEYYGNRPNHKDKVYEVIFNSVPSPKISRFAPFIQKLTAFHPCHTIDVRGCSLIKEIVIYDVRILRLGHQKPKVKGSAEVVNLAYVYDYFPDLKIDKMNVFK